jgi:leucyl aminopeptidase
MQIHLLTQSPLDLTADWLVVTCFEEDALPGLSASVDSALAGLLTRLRGAGDITGKTKELVPLFNVQGIGAQRVLVLGLGKRQDADAGALAAAAAAAGREISAKATRRVALALPDAVGRLTLGQMARALGVGLARGCQGPGIRKTKPDRFFPAELCLVPPAGALATEMEASCSRASAEASAVMLAQELVNTPPCDLYPASFAERARQIATASGLEIDVLDEQQIEAERMGAILGVAQGSDRPPRFVVLRHRGGGAQTLALVGKGVTFDSGGLSLKTNEQMLDMKCDMAGAAAVLAAMQAIASLKIPVNVHGYLPIVENMPSGRALKLGDVLRARNGKTIEIQNTDAEGRLILADALAYAVDDKVDHLVDLATLTGACMVALGTDVAGAMSNNEPWLRRVLGASQRAGEKAWALPMFPLYTEMIKSKVADIRNTGGSRYGGAITAAKFLEEFVGQVPWTHLDIAGPAWVESENAACHAGGSGCFVQTLVELAYDYAG